MRYLKTILLFIIFLLFSSNAYAVDNTTVCECPDSSFYVIKTDGCLYKTTYKEEFSTGKNDWDYDYNYINPKDMVSQKLADNIISVSYGNILKEDGTVWKFGGNIDAPVYIMDDVKSISASSALLMVKNDNTLWGVGNNTYGQLAQGTMEKTLEVQIAENMRHKNRTKCDPESFEEPVKIMDDVKTALIIDCVSVVLKNDGTVWTFGRDSGGGTLGIGGRWLTNNEPTQILEGIKEIFLSGEAAFALDYNNTLWRWGSNYIGYAGGDYTVKIPQKYIENVKTVTNMQGYNLVVKNDNSLWLYGDTSSDGGVISEKPLKLYDNVVSVTGLNEYTEETDRVLVLTENRDLLLLKIPVEYGTTEFNFEKIMGDVRLPNDLQTTTPTETTEPTEKPMVTPTATAAPETLTVEGGEEITVKVNGKIVEFPDAKPFVDENDRTQVPIRAVSEMLNARVDWQQDIKTAVITKDNGDTVKITLDSDIMLVNEKPIQMDTAAMLKDERTFIPVRFVAEALGLTVKWVE